MRTFLLKTLFLILLLNSSCQEKEDFSIDWEEDILQFQMDFKRLHPNPFTKITETEFDKDVDLLLEKARINNPKAVQMTMGIAKLLAKVGDSHSRIPFGWHGFLQKDFIAKWFSDGIYLTGARLKNGHVLGKRIVSIEGLEIQTLIDSLRTIIPYENESDFKQSFLQLIRSQYVYEYFANVYNPFGLLFGFDDGSEMLVGHSSDSYLQYEVDSLPLFLLNPNNYYNFIKLNHDGIYYIQYNTCRNGNLSFQKFTDDIIESFKLDSDYNKIVLDMRLNGGGNSSIAKPLLDSLLSLVKTNRISKDSIFVIIGKRTYSSAVLNILQLHASIDPIFVGEATGGKPNHFGEVQTFELENSDLRISYSTKYFKYLDADPDSFYPDVPIEYNSAHFLNGIDPVMEWIKKQ